MTTKNFISNAMHEKKILIAIIQLLAICVMQWVAPAFSRSDGFKSVVICHGEARKFTCTAGNVIYIHHAWYGRLNTKTCSVVGVRNRICQEDSHAVIWNKCEGERECELTAIDDEMEAKRCLEGERNSFRKYIFVKYHCDLPGKTVIGECGSQSSWGSWLSTDNPLGSGDFERKSDHQDLIDGCRFPSAVDIQLKEGGDYHEGNDVLQIGIDFGAQCLHDRQAKKCNDYKVRYCCVKGRDDRCIHPGKIANGFVSRRNRKFFRIGESVRYRCKNNFALVGAAVLRCQVEAKWSHAVPECRRTKLCKEAKPMGNGQVTYESGDTSIGSTILYSCKEGYSLTGNRRRTCLQHGSWSGMEPICERICAADKIYSKCAPKCPETCLDEFDVPKVNCEQDTDCQPGCVCPEGMLLLDKADDTCIKRRRCPRRKICKAYGDPHYIVFEGSSAFDFMGLCTYMMSETFTLGLSDRRWLSIAVENEARHNVTYGSWVKNVKIMLDGGLTEILLEKGGAKINGEAAVDSINAQFLLRTRGNSMHVTTAFGVTVTFNSNAVIIRMPTTYRNLVRGICGNFNKNSSDDLMKSNGEYAETFVEMSESFTVGRCEHSPGALRECSDDEKLTWSEEKFCGSLINRTGVFGNCVDAVSIVNQYYDACVFDMCATGGNNDVLLENLQAYYEECVEAQADPPCDWRDRLNHSKPTCPKNSHYTDCLNSCPTYCFNVANADGCKDTMISGCACDDGYSWEGDNCVLQQECGCVNNNQYFPKGSEVPSTYAGQRCVCLGNDEIICECAEDYIRDDEYCRKITCSDCHRNALCNDGGNSIKCECEVGYIGDGKECKKLACDELSGLEFGIFEYHDANHVGDFVTYQCEPGYILRGDAERTCQENGQWSGSEPFCRKTRCTRILALQHGTIAYTDEDNIGDLVTYRCENGYVLRGESSRICQEDGQWSGLEPSCEEVLCQHSLIIEYGDLSVTAIRMGDFITYKCNPGFSLRGVSKRVCQENGTWSGEAPFCEETSCTRVLTLAHGTIDYSDENNVGDLVTFRCDSGYALRGDSTRICQEDGQWSGLEPSCEEILCRQSLIIEYGEFSVTGIRMGDSITYKCNPGFSLRGVSKRVCQENGTWSGEAPFCEETSCTRVITLEHGTIDYSDENSVGDLVTFRCDSGYALRGDSTRICQEDGQWSGSEPSCEEIMCRQSLIIEYGEFSVTGIRMGDSITYKCNPGFSLRGVSKRVCQENGTWSGEAPFCEETSCTRVLTLEHGTIDYSDENSVGDLVTFRCDSGYALRGDSTRICQEDGQWSGSEPSCEEIMCRQSLIIEYGDITVTGVGIGDSITYQCNPGFSLRGDPKRFCQQNGTWSGEAPFCEETSCKRVLTLEHGTMEYSGENRMGDSVTFQCDIGYALTGDTTRICQEDGQWSGSEPSCEEILCRQSLIIEYGDISATGVRMGDSITYQCNPGFSLRGDPKRVCQQNGTWSGEAPICEEILCTEVLSFENGFLESSDQSNKVGDVITYRCQPGFSLRGDSKRMCKDDGSWSGVDPICKETDCTRTLTLEHGFVEYSGKNGVGDLVTYLCDFGYTLKGEAERTCQQNGRWSGSEPSCEQICEAPKRYSDCVRPPLNSCLDRHDLPSEEKRDCVPGCICPKGTMTVDRYNSTCVKRRHCPKRAVCRVWGDPHYVMFQRSTIFDYMELCNMTLLEPVDINTSDDRWLTVSAENEMRPPIRAGSFVKSAKIRLRGGEIEVIFEKSGAKVDGVPVSDLRTPLFNLHTRGRNQLLTTYHGVTILYNGNAVVIKAPTLYREQVRGLCGDLNDDPSDDFKTPDGVIVDDVADFAAGYQIGKCSGQFTPINACTAKDRAKWSEYGYCGSISNETGVFADCAQLLDTAKGYYEACLFDMCATEGDRKTLLEALTTFVDECRDIAPVTCEWRVKLGLNDDNCPPNSQYEACPINCQRSCYNIEEPSTCSELQEGRCECGEGLLFEGLTCIPESECGCTMNGEYLKKGSYYDDYNSNEECTCLGAGILECSCMVGYVRDREGCRLESCKDPICDENADCFETALGSSCVCKKGFAGDGWRIGIGCRRTGVSCKKPKPFPNGIVHHNIPPYKVSKFLIFECNVGYLPRRIQQRICRQDGTWSGSLTMCYKMQSAK